MREHGAGLPFRRTPSLWPRARGADPTGGDGGGRGSEVVERQVYGCEIEGATGSGVRREKESFYAPGDMGKGPRPDGWVGSLLVIAEVIG